MIQRAIGNFNWETTFSSLHIDDCIKLFNETVLNIFSNFCPSKIIVCNDKDPPWHTNEVKNLITLKNHAFKMYQENPSGNFEYDHVLAITKQLNETLKVSKEEYYEKLTSQLMNPATSTKKYWSILKTHLNGKKIPLIPPLLHNNEFISDFTEKAQIFNEFFSNQCTPIDNDSEIPRRIILETNETFEHIDFSVADIFNIIRNLDSNKAHGYDNLSVKLIKICGFSICRPLEIIFQKCLAQGIFPEYWKRANVVPIHKKNEKNLVGNYRPISLLPIFSKIFERLIFNSFYNYLIAHDLLTHCQSGFRPGDSCSNRFLLITH